MGVLQPGLVPMEKMWSYNPREAEETVALLRCGLPEGQRAHLMLRAPGSSHRKPLSKQRWVPGIWCKGLWILSSDFSQPSQGDRCHSHRFRVVRAEMRGKRWEDSRESLAGEVQEGFLEEVTPVLFE